MGRYLALGLVTKIQIERGKDNWGLYSEDIKISKEKDKILKDMNNIIDTSKYKIKYKKEEDSIYLELKDIDFFNENIHNLIKELYPLIDCRYRIDPEKGNVSYDKTFTKEKYPFNLIEKDNKFYEELTKSYEEYAYWQVPETFLFKNEKYKNGLKCDICYIPIWIDWNKVGCESEHYILKLLNTMSRKYIESSLIRIMLFYIYG